MEDLYLFSRRSETQQLVATAKQNRADRRRSKIFQGKHCQNKTSKPNWLHFHRTRPGRRPSCPPYLHSHAFSSCILSCVCILILILILFGSTCQPVPISVLPARWRMHQTDRASFCWGHFLSRRNYVEKHGNVKTCDQAIDIPKWYFLEHPSWDAV